MPERIDPVRDIETIATCIAMDVHHAISAAIIMRAADLMFHGHRDWFWSNPANALQYAALHALEDRSIVHLAELLRAPALQVPPEVRHVESLALHRNAVSHPLLIEWGNPDMKVFHDQKRRYLDVRAVFVWDMNVSVNELLSAAGRPQRNSTFQVNPQMADMFSSIMRASQTQPALAQLPNAADTLSALQSFWLRFSDFLIKRATP